MNDSKKRILIPVIVGIILLAGIVLLSLYRMNGAAQLAETGDEQDIEERIAQDENTDINKENGIIYRNSEIYVIAKEDATKEEIQTVAKKTGAKLRTELSDIGIYLFVFDEKKTYEEIEKIIKKLNKEDCIEKADFNYAGETHVDEYIPSDPWNNASWNVNEPRDENWGMEAIDAPGAWDYSDKMAKTKVGLIDSVPDTEHEDLDFEGFSYFYLDNNGMTKLPETNVEADSHGTHVAGTIAAIADNDVGVTGVMLDRGSLYYSRIGKSDDYDGSISSAYEYVLGIQSLLDEDVRAINISLGLHPLIVFAASHGNDNARRIVEKNADLVEIYLKRIINERKKNNKPDFVLCLSAGNYNDRLFYKDDSQTYGYRQNPNFIENMGRILGLAGEKGGMQAKYNSFLLYINDATIRNRIICVGSIKQQGLLGKKSLAYSGFSCIGDRVDIVAPGEKIYSCTTGDSHTKYEIMNGTSMSAPHVTGVAGLIFACNPELTGPEVRKILLDTVSSRFYFESGNAGLVNAKNAVEYALDYQAGTNSEVLEKGIEETEEELGGLDLCFVIDTTGSMNDDIANTKENMSSILKRLNEKTDNYRVAIIDYRDYPERSNASEDYPYKLQLPFSGNSDVITKGIESLELGNGGDDLETVYSGLIHASLLDWRKNARKVIIIMGDAGPLDPEPITNYTYDDVIAHLIGNGIELDTENSDERAIDLESFKGISVYSIGTSPSSAADSFMEEISNDTGGTYRRVEQATEVSDAIMDSIQEIELNPERTISIIFDEKTSDSISVYTEDGDFVLASNPKENGTATVKLQNGKYIWKDERLGTEGRITVKKNKETATAVMTKASWYTPVVALFVVNSPIVMIIAVMVVLFAIMLPLITNELTKKRTE